MIDFKDTHKGSKTFTIAGEHYNRSGKVEKRNIFKEEIYVVYAGDRIENIIMNLICFKMTNK